MINRRFMPVCVLACILALVVASAAVAKETETVPIKVTSDKLSYDAGGQKVTFKGNVHVTHPDAELWADQISILLADDGKKQAGGADTNMDPGKIDRIVAEGSVRVALGDGKDGECEKAVYVIAPGVLTMTGNPVLRDGSNSIQGREIKFYVKQNRSEVSGSSNNPVEAIFSAPKRIKK